jgi:beta-galactosidase
MQRGLYRLGLSIPESWRGKKLRLLFDGVQSFSTVFCNGKNVGGRPYGYLPILCDITDAVEYGKANVIAVSADNRHNSGDRWYSGAGIYRPVWLLVDEESHITHDGVTVVTRENRVVAVEASLELEPGFAGTLEIKLLTPDGRTAAQCTYPASDIVRAEFAIDDALLWSPESPSLYRAELRLLDGTVCIDCQTVVFGVRTAVFVKRAQPKVCVAALNKASGRP